MKATITLELNDLDDISKYRRVMAAEDAFSALWNIEELAVEVINSKNNLTAEEMAAQIIAMIREDLPEFGKIYR